MHSRKREKSGGSRVTYVIDVIIIYSYSFPLSTKKYERNFYFTLMKLCVKNPDVQKFLQILFF